MTEFEYVCIVKLQFIHFLSLDYLIIIIMAEAAKANIRQDLRRSSASATTEPRPRDTRNAAFSKRKIQIQPATGH